MRNVTMLVVRTEHAQIIKVKGREAWALHALLQAGTAGLAPIDRPAPRWSCYVHRLRRRGLDIQTIRERHRGPYSGAHGRYRLSEAVEVIEVRSEGGSAVRAQSCNGASF